MSHRTYTPPVDEDDAFRPLDRLLMEDATGVPCPGWLIRLADEGAVDGSLDDLLDAAAERDPRGPAATVEGLIEALRVRHAADNVTLAMLAALQHMHLPDLLDEVREARSA